jgi:hypothetical protein
MEGAMAGKKSPLVSLAMTWHPGRKLVRIESARHEGNTYYLDGAAGLRLIVSFLPLAAGRGMPARKGRKRRLPWQPG